MGIQTLTVKTCDRCKKEMDKITISDWDEAQISWRGRVSRRTRNGDVEGADFEGNTLLCLPCARLVQEFIKPVAQRICNACEWTGPESDCVYCGDVGPLCPECRETTDVYSPSASAPVADERATFENRFDVPPENWSKSGGGGYRNIWIETRWEGWQARAALASAPVAGEATDTFRNLLLEAVHRYGNARALAEHDIKQRGQISTTVAAILDLLDAAPQASKDGEHGE